MQKIGIFRLMCARRKLAAKQKEGKGCGRPSDHRRKNRCRRVRLIKSDLERRKEKDKNEGGSHELPRLHQLGGGKVILTALKIVVTVSK